MLFVVDELMECLPDSTSLCDIFSVLNFELFLCSNSTNRVDGIMTKTNNTIIDAISMALKISFEERCAFILVDFPFGLFPVTCEAGIRSVDNNVKIVQNQ